ncbi:MAG: FAD-dependent oxidoreductase [Synergistaceae bacterium]|nr:FAD-dependent oxidoreductase [Synergistaceae bacterium]
MKNRPKIVIVGGGWGGCAAAEAAARAGAQVTLLERTDMLLGTGLVGGIFRNNGRQTAAEEMTALGVKMFSVMDSVTRHRNVAFPGHEGASLYDVYAMEPAVKAFLADLGVDIVLQASVSAIGRERDRITAVTTRDGRRFEAEAVVDGTGTSAAPAKCNSHGRGCAMCILRCHSFLPRTSVTALAGVEEWNGAKADGSVGAMSGSCKLFKESLHPSLVAELNEKGVCLVPLPDELREDLSILGTKACQQYALKEFIENIVLLDTGPAKLMTPYFPLEALRRIPGFERARYEDPIAGGKGNSMRYFGFARCDETLRAQGEVTNLFCAGEKAGAMVGHTEAVVTGALAGRNAVAVALGLEPTAYPEELALGDFIAHVIPLMATDEGRRFKYTFSGSVYFERMKERGLYITDGAAVARRVEATGLSGLFAEKLL